MLQIKRSELKKLAQNKLGNDSVESQNKIIVMISTAMAARTSYTVVGEESKRTSEQWQKQFPDIIVLDPDGWNRDERYNFEWFEEKITLEEYKNKVMKSTCKFKVKFEDYFKEEKTINYENLIALHDRLLTQEPPHSSPFEHCAKAMSDEEYYSSIKTSKYPIIIPKNDKDREINGGIVNCELYPQHLEYGKNIDKNIYGWCYNLKGFISYRYLIDNKIDL